MSTKGALFNKHDEFGNEIYVEKGGCLPRLMATAIVAGILYYGIAVGIRKIFKRLHYAPSSLNTPAGLIRNPKRLSYLQAGWKFLDLQPPADPPSATGSTPPATTTSSSLPKTSAKTIRNSPPPSLRQNPASVLPTKPPRSSRK